MSERILWKWKERPEIREGDHWPCKAFRWVFMVSGSSDHVCAEIVHQHQWKSSGEWGTSHTAAYGVALQRGMRWWGIRHDYYDGPHCSLAVGPLYIFWGGDPRTNWCRKCAGE